MSSRDGAYAFSMQLLSIRAAVAAVWVLAVCLAGIAGSVNAAPLGWMSEQWLAEHRAMNSL